MAGTQLMQPLEIVVHETIENGEVAAGTEDRAAAKCKGDTSDSDRDRLQTSGAERGTKYKSPSPEYVDTVQEQQGIMGETAGTGGETSEVSKWR